MESSQSAGQVAGHVAGRTLIVGADWSTESQKAIEWARAVAGPDDRIVLVHAWQMPVVAGYDMVLAVDPAQIEQAANEGLTEEVGELADARLEPIVRQGHPGRSLVTEADERDAAMIVVGHSGNSRVGMMLGSTANYVLHHTTRPVVVVRGDVVADGAEVTPPRSIVVGVDDHDLDPDDPATHENPSVRAVRWAFQLPGVERVRVVHAWFLPSLAIGVHAEIRGRDGRDGRCRPGRDRSRAGRRRRSAGRCRAGVRARPGNTGIRDHRGVA